MKVFEPLTTQWSPSRTAVVFSMARSAPPDGSVIAILHTSAPAATPGQPPGLLVLGAQLHKVRRAGVGMQGQATRPPPGETPHTPRGHRRVTGSSAPPR